MTDLKLQENSDVNLSTKHIVELDGIRGLAIVLVLIVHAYYRGPQLNMEAGIFSNMVSDALVFGWTGVELFFVLSGFLITNILHDEKSMFGYIDIKSFYVKRLARILPVYYLFVSIVVALSFFDLSAKLNVITEDALRNSWIYYLFLSNWSDIWNINVVESGKLLGVSWSLAVEEQFYLVWPLIVMVLNRRRLLIIIPFLFCALVILRGFLQGMVSSDLIYHWTLTHLDGLLVGSFLALIYSDENSRERLNKVSGLILVISICSVTICYLIAGTLHYSNEIVQLFGYSAIAIFWGAMLWCSINERGKLSYLMRLRFFRIFGKYSYFLYLAHWPVYMGISQAKLPSGGLAFLAYLIVVNIGLLAAAAISYRFFELPITNRARNFAKYQKQRRLRASGNSF